MNNNILLWILATIAIIIAFNVFFGKREGLAPIADSTSSKAQDFAILIKNYLKADTEYKDYLDFLVAHNNQSYKILSQETFYELKMLLKMDALTVEKIASYLTDI
jgi:uncharacterized membrane protein required for colicin V production